MSYWPPTILAKTQGSF
jgi:hypothetical protein